MFFQPTKLQKKFKRAKKTFGVRSHCVIYHYATKIYARQQILTSCL